MPDRRPRPFRPDQVAYYEKANYEAYYNRDWPRVFWTFVQLSRETFGMSWLTALAAAVDGARAAIAFAPAEGNDVPKAQQLMARYFEKARRSARLRADAHTLAALEVNWWVVHRQLAIARQPPPHADNLEPLVEAFTRLHAALFDGSPEAIRCSADYRAQACRAVDRITGHYSEDIAADWREVEHCLQQAYRALAADQQPAPADPAP